ncbi:thioredoxin family protein [Nocardioidaceae bacterium]|nr:thioredoxin family protein [Nocardioidaceae bacterium]
MTGFIVLVIALVAATAFGLYRTGTDGRFTGTRAVRGADGADGADRAADSAQPTGEKAVETGEEPASDDAVLTLGEADLDGPLGERATLVQFSSAFCAPCRVARRVLGEVATEEAGVRHVEIDAESHLELVRAAGVMRTPTTLVLDAAGREVARASGAPTKAQVSASLAELR